PEPDDEDGAEHDARDRVRDFDVWPDDVGEERNLPEQDPYDNSRKHAIEKAEKRLFHRDTDLQPQRAVLSAVDRPVVKLLDDAAWLPEEERVDDLEMGEQLPP